LGVIANKCVIFKHQVNNFAIAAPDEQTANILMDMTNDNLTMPIKQQGLLDMFNGINVVQTWHYIKISCHTYTSAFCDKYCAS
jgi:hypothetical protein